MSSAGEDINMDSIVQSDAQPHMEVQSDAFSKKKKKVQSDAQPHMETSSTLVGQLLSIKKIFQRPNVSNNGAEDDDAAEHVAEHDDAEHVDAMASKRELFKDSQIYNLLGVKKGSGCSAALIDLVSELFDQGRGTFKIKDGTEFDFCAHRVADVLSIKNTGQPIGEFKIKGKEIKLPPFVEDLKLSHVTQNQKKERIDRNDKNKHNNRSKRDLSCKSLVQILRCMPVETDEQKDQYKQLVRLFVVDQILLPSSENEYIRSGNYKYCADGTTFESINWAQAILDRIYDAVKKKRRTFGACSTVFQALIYDKFPKLVPKDMKLKTTLVPADKYPVCRRPRDDWKSDLDKLKAEDINECDLCSPHGHGHLCSPHGHGLHMQLFQKACEGVILARAIGKARQILEGSHEGEYLSDINDSALVEDLKTEYLRMMDDRGDWALIEALSKKDAVRYLEPETQLIDELDPSSAIVHQSGNVETGVHQSGDGEASSSKLAVDQNQQIAIKVVEETVETGVHQSGETQLVEQEKQDTHTKTYRRNKNDDNRENVKGDVNVSERNVNVPKKNERKRHREPSTEDNHVHSRIKVWWPLDKEFYSGVIASFNTHTKRHKVRYDDGTVENLNLKKETWEFIETAGK